MPLLCPPRPSSGTTGGPRSPRTMLRLAAVLGLLSLSAYLVLPLLYTCRTYRIRIHSCCGARPIPSFARSGGHGAASAPCPFCSVLSPLKHGRHSTHSPWPMVCGIVLEAEPIYSSPDAAQRPTPHRARAPPLLS